MNVVLVKIPRPAPVTLHFIFKDRFWNPGMDLENFNGAPLDAEEYSMSLPLKKKTKTGDVPAPQTLRFETATLRMQGVV